MVGGGVEDVNATLFLNDLFQFYDETFLICVKYWEQSYSYLLLYFIIYKIFVASIIEKIK